MSSPLESLIDNTLKNIKNMVDVNTIIGEPMKAGEDITIIPVSRVAFGFGSGGSVFGENERITKRICAGQATAVEQLATENPENIYIFDFLLAMCNVAYPDYSDQLPTNLFYWGGSYLGTDAFDRQLELNGIEKFDASLFLQDNVYFVTLDYMGEIYSLWPYMQEKYSATVCNVVNRLVDDTIVVYKFG